MGKKIFCFVSVFVLIFSVFCFSVSAETSDYSLSFNNVYVRYDGHTVSYTSSITPTVSKIIVDGTILAGYTLSFEGDFQFANLPNGSFMGGSYFSASTTSELSRLESIDYSIRDSSGRYLDKKESIYGYTFYLSGQPTNEVFHFKVDVSFVRSTTEFAQLSFNTFEITLYNSRGDVPQYSEPELGRAGEIQAAEDEVMDEFNSIGSSAATEINSGTSSSLTSMLVPLTAVTKMFDEWVLGDTDLLTPVLYISLGFAIVAIFVGAFNGLQSKYNSQQRRRNNKKGD